MFKPTPSTWTALRVSLRERLLRAGIAPRHVRRYLRELADHLDDLRAEEQARGLSVSAAEEAAIARLGTQHSLADAMIRRPELRAWSARVPWLAFSLAPLLALAAAYAAACFILWCGWRLYLADHATPFVPLHGVTIPFFGVGRLLFFTGPVLVGWAAAYLAARQRIDWRWPAASFLLLAVFGAMAQVRTHAEATADTNHPWALHVGMRFSFPNEEGFAGHTLAYNVVTHGMLHAVMILALIVLPPLVLSAAVRRPAFAEPPAS